MANIEYFYSSHSGYAYVGSTRFMEIAAKAGRRIDHRPMDLRAVVAVTGPGPTNGLTEGRRTFFSGHVIRRWAEARDAAILDERPTHHDHEIALSNGMLIAGLQQGINIDQLAHEMLHAHWRDDADLDDRDSLARIGEAAGVDPAPLLDAAMSGEVQAIYRKNTEEAIARSVFGSPTYFIDGDMFYGQDNLELVEQALVKPFSRTWPPA